VAYGSLSGVGRPKLHVSLDANIVKACLLRVAVQSTGQQLAFLMSGTLRVAAMQQLAVTYVVRVWSIAVVTVIAEDLLSVGLSCLGHTIRGFL
jgi:hypothetical protein